MYTDSNMPELTRAKFIDTINIPTTVFVAYKTFSHMGTELPMHSALLAYGLGVSAGYAAQQVLQKLYPIGNALRTRFDELMPESLKQNKYSHTLRDSERFKKINKINPFKTKQSKRDNVPTRLTKGQKSKYFMDIPFVLGGFHVGLLATWLCKVDYPKDLIVQSTMIINGYMASRGFAKLVDFEHVANTPDCVYYDPPKVMSRDCSLDELAGFRRKEAIDEDIRNNLKGIVGTTRGRINLGTVLTLNMLSVHILASEIQLDSLSSGSFKVATAATGLTMLSAAKGYSDNKKMPSI